MTTVYDVKFNFQAFTVVYGSLYMSDSDKQKQAPRSIPRKR